jgi:O-antigen ligase
MPRVSRADLERVIRENATWRDARSLVVATVIASSFVVPNLAWREGALICALILVSSMSGFRPAAADVAAAALAVLAFASLLWTSSTALTLNTSENLAASAIVFASIRATCRRRRDVAIVAYGFLVGATIAVLAAGGNASGFRLTYQSTADRIGLEGVNVNFTAYSLVTAAAVMVALVLFRRTHGSYLGLVAGCGFFALVYLGVVLTGARGALASLVGLIAWIVVSRLVPRLAWRVLIVTYVIANVAIVSGWSDAALGKLVTGSTRETGDLNGRLGVWPLARQVFREHWLLGGGAGSLPSQPGNTMGINAHAVVLDVAAGLGVLGILAFACMWVFAFREPLVSGDTRVVTRALGAFLVVSLPVILSGFWVESIVLWAAIALFSRIDLLAVEDERAYSEGARGVTVDR